MSTFLELSQQVHKLAQVQGSLHSVADPGINGEIANLVKNAWVDIQGLRNNFTFMRKTLAFTLSPTVNTYLISTLIPPPATDDVGRWIDDEGSLYLTSPAGGPPFAVRFLPYDSLRLMIRTYEDSAAPPSYWSFSPSNLALMFFPAPNLIYSGEIDYYRSPQTLVNNQDVPHIRSQWHDIIAYKAASEFTAGKSIYGLHQRYDLRYSQRVGELFREFVPAVNATIRPAA